MQTDAQADSTDAQADIESAEENAQELLEAVVTAIGGKTRAGQLEMCRAVARTIATGHNLAVQAGTGTGKSLAYLVPAVLAAGNQRIVISTATLGLQRQLVVKDLPAVIAQLDTQQVKPQVAVLKGWSHYLCLARLEGAYPANTLFGDNIEAIGSRVTKQLARIRKWDTDTGDRDELQPGVSDKIWRQVSLPRNRCLGSKCPFHDECYAIAARQRAADADIVVTNHAIMGVAASSNPAILGDPDITIVDEAHALVDHVRSQATLTLSLPQLRNLARAIKSEDSKSAEAITQATDALEDALKDLPDGLQNEVAPALIDASVLLDEALREAASALNDTSGPTAAILKNDLRDFGDVIAAAIDPKLVRWIEFRNDEPELVCTPLSVSGRIRERFANSGRFILTSATMKTGGSFQTIARSCGLEGADVPWSGIDVGSPFDYAKRGISYIAADLPAPAAPGLSEAAKERICALIKASGGGALCLFSSYRALDDAKAYLDKHLDLPLVAQGDDQLSTLIDRFTEERDLTLLGTLSLWQGIDAPGATCRLVIIDRIPFPHPANPLVQARNRAVEEKGGNSFAQVSLPAAGLLLAQGAGRLIRRLDDQGVLALLDSRLLHKSYGSYLRRDLPGLWPTTELETVTAALARLHAALPSTDDE